ncbi:hypothetical protein N7520_007092 [Penicillium odoratum]|uniref:uncharacterized protein n=1 Tax=Penicillium odoratum TaxID=1167516 RepID=UPI002548FCD1|nr:uncharacterized protein N7520_007092 [Penicillium odoratum]KAJ5759936.1 hypothetical protein N7520_007092 [Penicillium odoratum]
MQRDQVCFLPSVPIIPTSVAPVVTPAVASSSDNTPVDSFSAHQAPTRQAFPPYKTRKTSTTTATESEVSTDEGKITDTEYYNWRQSKSCTRSRNQKVVALLKAKKSANNDDLDLVLRFGCKIVTTGLTLIQEINKSISNVKPSQGPGRLVVLP